MLINQWDGTLVSDVTITLYKLSSYITQFTIDAI